MQFELLPPVPATVLVRELRQTPLFDFASVDELFRFSGIARQVRHTEGSTFQKQGAPAEHIQLLIEGQALVSGTERADEETAPPRLFGFREVLEGIPLSETARAKANSICLAMGAEDFRALLSDNIELAEGVFRMLLETPAESAPPSVLKGVARADSEKVSLDPSQDMRPVDKALLLQTLPIFSRARAEELMELAAVAREVSLTPENDLFGEVDPSSIWVIPSGEVSLESTRGEEPIHVTAGDALGIDETLVGRAMDRRGRVTGKGRALKIERGDLFELLAHRTDLLQGLFGALFRSSSSSTRGNL